MSASSRARGRQALDALRCCVLLTNEHGTILHANRAAEHMLDEGGPIQSSQGISSDRSIRSELRSALAVAAGNETGIGKTGLAIRLTDRDLPPVFAHVLPLTGSDFRTRLQPAAGCGRIHRRVTGRAGWCRRPGCRLRSDAPRNPRARQPFRRSHA
jgi:PAS domain-containing protein